MTTVTLADIVVDPTIQVREVENFTVSTYAQAMKAGAKFPPVVLEQGTNRLVAGNHRYYAYKSVGTPETKIPCTYRTFKDEAEVIRFAAKDNAQHGRPLDTWDKKRIAMRLRQLGDDPELISEILGVTVSRVESWAEMAVIVTGKKGKKQLRTPQPVKHGLEHMAGKEITAEVYEEHKKRDYGTTVKNLAAIITRHITDELIDVSDEKTIENLKALHTALSTFLKKDEVAA